MDSGNTKYEQVPTWGASLPVANVQEMVRKDPFTVPQRYIRNPNDQPKTSPVLSSDVPTIDLSLLSCGNIKELEKMDMACTQWGFFQVVNHGILEQVTESMMDAAREFFTLPFQEKNRYAMPHNDIQGYGNIVVSEEEKLDWTDAMILFVYPSSCRKLKYWPTEPSKLKDNIEMYSADVRKVAETLLGSLSLIMKMKEGSLLEKHKELMQALRVNYYPTCSEPDLVLGKSPHSDASSITILMQDEDVKGLQVRNNGNWVSVNPIPNAFVVNIGDVVQIWSNGKYKSVEHRVVTDKEKTRMSLATFITPNQDVEIEPLDQMVDDSNPVKLYKKMRYGDYLRASLKKKLDGRVLHRIS